LAPFAGLADEILSTGNNWASQIHRHIPSSENVRKIFEYYWYVVASKIYVKHKAAEWKI